MYFCDVQNVITIRLISTEPNIKEYTLPITTKLPCLYSLSVMPRLITNIVSLRYADKFLFYHKNGIYI